MERAGKRKIVDVEKGLFLVRYAAAQDALQPPQVSLSPEPPTDRSIAFFLHPDQSEAVLWQPGGCVVVRAAARGRLAVDVTPAGEHGSANATIRIEPLTQGQARERATRTPTGAGAPRDLGDFRLQGHVASIGDVVVDADHWLAGPSNPSRIEGISIAWPGKPDDVDIRYSVRTARAQAISGRVMELGSFAGTRGKGLPLVGLMIELSGPGAANFQFVAEAIFLGSPAMRISGRRVLAEGPTSREPLVGLRLRLQQLNAPQRVEPAAAAAAPHRSSSRVRVFRNQAPPDRLAAR
ncbi:MAG: hypothetical protein ACLQE9_08965 [Roseiarcus sp.]